jgi:hypothetical protein
MRAMVVIRQIRLDFDQIDPSPPITIVMHSTGGQFGGEYH